MSDPSDLSDDELLQFIRARGVPGAQAEAKLLVGRLLEGLRPHVQFKIGDSLAGATTADDLIQETFLRAIRALDKIEIRSQGELRAWLRQQADRTILDAARKMNRRLDAGGNRLQPGPDESHAVLFDQLVAGSSSTPSRFASVRERADRVRRGMVELSESERDLIRLHYLEFKTAAEIAAILGRSTSAVEMALSRARSRLAAILARLDRASPGPEALDSL